MLRLKGDQIALRAIEPSDLDFLYELENNPAIWEISGTLKPYSKQVLRRYLENAHRDIFEARQLRLCITDLEGNTLGLIDLFDFDPKHCRAGMGILIKDDESRNKGVGSEAVRLVCDYAFFILELRQIYVNVAADNARSLRFFEKQGFKRVGVKKDWIRHGGCFKDEVLLQKIKD